MKRVRHAGLWLALVGAFGASSATRAAWQFSPATDPERRWSVSLWTGAGYDDNFNTAPKDKQSSLSTAIEPQLLVSLPMERTELGLRYTYNATYYGSRPGNKISQSHAADTMFSWRIDPRLNLSVGDTLRRGLEPGLVEQQGGVPIIARQRGDYTYNSLSTQLSYNLTRRWTASVVASWEVWSYDLPLLANVNDQNSYATLLSALYSIDPRTYVGGNYRFSTVEYTNPGPSNARNSNAHQGFISIVRQFNPQLSGQVNGGMELREFGDGTLQMAPSLSASLSYNYGPASSLVGNFSYYLSTTEVGAYRSTDVAAGRLQVNHRLTTRLNVSASAAYSLSTYQNPTPLPPPFSLPAGLTEEAFTCNLNLGYAFMRWMEANLSYTHENASSQVAGRSFDRNRIWLGLRARY